MTESTNEERARAAGFERGVGAGSWVLDGNSSASAARAILTGLEDGDPEIMDVQPAPLSGEWAGESIPELSADLGIDLEDDELATIFEAAFSEGFWQEVERSARAMLEDADVETTPVNWPGHGGFTGGA